MAGEPRCGCVDAFYCRFDQPVGIPLTRPDRRDEEQAVSKAIKSEDDGRAHKEHVGQAEFVRGGARQFFDQAHCFITEITDQTGERFGKLRWHVDMAGGREGAECRQTVIGNGMEVVAVGRPIPVDLGLMAISAKDEVRRKANQAIASAHRAALN